MGRASSGESRGTIAVFYRVVNIYLLVLIRIERSMIRMSEWWIRMLGRHVRGARLSGRQKRRRDAGATGEATRSSGNLERPQRRRRSAALHIGILAAGLFAAEGDPGVDLGGAEGGKKAG